MGRATGVSIGQRSVKIKYMRYEQPDIFEAKTASSRPGRALAS